MMHKQTSRYMTVIATMLVLSATANAFSAQTQSPSLFAANTFREALEPGGVRPEMAMVSRTRQEMREIVSRNLDPRLLGQIRRISGRDYKYRLGEPNRTVQLGVIVLIYPTDPLTKRMEALLSRERGYFRNSKILIHFLAVRLDNILVIMYSENSGDDRVVEALNNLPAAFEKASSTKRVRWDETPDSE